VRHPNPPVENISRRMALYGRSVRVPFVSGSTTPKGPEVGDRHALVVLAADGGSGKRRGMCSAARSRSHRRDPKDIPDHPLTTCHRPRLNGVVTHHFVRVARHDRCSRRRSNRSDRREPNVCSRVPATRFPEKPRRAFQAVPPGPWRSSTDVPS